MMDLIDSLNQLASRIPRLQETVQTEEATKNALVMPVLQALGYNVFDPFEVIPEFTADVGTKRNEKVDYAIVREGKPAILIECKCINAPLSLNHASQLFRYFACTDARFAILTNGIDYHFYTDIEAPNKMDDKPFFEFSLLSLEPRKVAEFKKFSKSLFELDRILSNAEELKYKKQIRLLLSQELDCPSDEFVRFFAKQVYDGSLTQERRARFTTLVSQAFREWVNNRISERLQNALEGVNPANPPVQENQEAAAADSAEVQEKAADGIVTTSDEREAYHIVRAILAQLIDPQRIFLKDTKSYCGVLLDFNVRKPLCRFLFTSNQKTLILLDKQRVEKRIALESVVDLYKHAEVILNYAKLYL